MAGDVLCVIPARYASTRLPAKPLVEIGGVPMVMWVYRAARASGAFSAVVVATDDVRIERAVSAHGGLAAMTSPDHERGTDRVWEVARARKEQFVVNLQGDEPGISPDLLRQFADTLRSTIDNASILTCISEAPVSQMSNPNAVKVAVGVGDRAVYFSRSPIPYDHGTPETFVKHTGIYGFSRASLERFCSLAPGVLERAEKLEQLRALENGMNIYCMRHQHEVRGIDTPQDLAAFEELVRAGDVRIAC